MTANLSVIDRLPGVHRIENCAKEELTSLAMEMTHAVYPHDEVYGQYCSLQDYIDCPPEKAFEYLADVYTLQEWTYSLRDFTPMDESGLVDRHRPDRRRDEDLRPRGRQPRGHDGRLPLRLGPGRPAVDDLPDARRAGAAGVRPARLRHPLDQLPAPATTTTNPFPEKAPPGRKVWVGDMWPFFYAGHKIELDNLKHILEYRHANGLPMTIGGPA